MIPPIWEYLLFTRIEDPELLGPLHGGRRDKTPWSAFLARLSERSGADAAQLAISTGDRRRHFPEAGALASLSPTALAQLRPNRVYALEEIDAVFGKRPSFGRLVSVNGEDWSAWLALTRGDDDFSASTSALLSALAPHLAIAVGNWVEMERLRDHASISDALLRRAGVTWRAVDEPSAADNWSAPSSEAETLAAKAKQALREGAPIIHTDARDILVTTCHDGRAVMVMRTPIPSHAGQLQSLAKAWSLSPSEARFALTLAEGKSLSEAAEALGLTIETARHYSKKLYAKTGARGLPDLVRLVLSSVAMLA